MNERAMIDGLRLTEAERSMHESNTAARELDAIAKDLLPALEASGTQLPAGETPGARVMAWLLHDQLNPPGPYRRGSASSLANAFTLIRRQIQASTGEGDAPPAWMLDELRQLAATHRDYHGAVERHPAGSDAFRLRYFGEGDYQRLREGYYPIVEPAPPVKQEQQAPPGFPSAVVADNPASPGSAKPGRKKGGQANPAADKKIAEEYARGLEAGEWNSKADFARKRHPSKDRTTISKAIDRGDALRESNTKSAKRSR